MVCYNQQHAFQFFLYFIIWLQKKNKKMCIRLNKNRRKYFLDSVTFFYVRCHIHFWQKLFEGEKHKMCLLWCFYSSFWVLLGQFACPGLDCPFGPCWSCFCVFCAWRSLTRCSTSSAGRRLHSSARQVQPRPVGRVSVHGGRTEVRHLLTLCF